MRGSTHTHTHTHTHREQMNRALHQQSTPAIDNNNNSSSSNNNNNKQPQMHQHLNQPRNVCILLVLPLLFVIHHTNTLMMMMIMCDAPKTPPTPTHTPTTQHKQTPQIPACGGPSNHLYTTAMVPQGPCQQAPCQQGACPQPSRPPPAGFALVTMHPLPVPPVAVVPAAMQAVHEVAHLYKAAHLRRLEWVDEDLVEVVRGRPIVWCDVCRVVHTARRVGATRVLWLAHCHCSYHAWGYLQGPLSTHLQGPHVILMKRGHTRTMTARKHRPTRVVGVLLRQQAPPQQQHMQHHTVHVERLMSHPRCCRPQMMTRGMRMPP